MKKTTWALALVLVGVAGCNFQQDPFAKYGDNIKNAVPPGTPKDTPPKGIDPGTLVIDAPIVMAFKENNESKYPVDYRVLIPNLPAKMEVTGLPDGAIWDDAKREIRWKPAKGLSGGSSEAMYKVTLKLSTTKAPYFVKEEERYLIVSRLLSVPKVLGFRYLPRTLAEGQKADFEVVVEDPDSDGQTAPTVVFKTSAMGEVQQGPLPQLISQTLFGQPRYDGNNQWSFPFQMSTIDQSGSAMELSKNKWSYVVGVQTFSRYGIASQVGNMSVDIVSAARTPQISWESGTTSVRSGEQFTYTFQAFDAFGDTGITVTNLSNLNNFPGGATLTCSQGATTAQRNCTLNWNVSGGAGTSQTLSLKLTGTGSAGDKREVTVNKTFSIQ